MELTSVGLLRRALPVRQAFVRTAPCACGVLQALSIGPGQAYNEEAFRYFLGEERKRSHSSSTPFMLLLVDFAEGTSEIDVAHARTLFARLALCLRETDILGWYRKGRIAGAVLTQLSDPLCPGLARRMSERVDSMVRGALPGEMSRRLRVRVLPVPARRVQRQPELIRN